MRNFAVLKVVNTAISDTPMQYEITAPSQINVTIDLPASKSMTNRALIMHALSRATMPLHNISLCDDAEVMTSALSQPQGTIDIKASGTAMRFLTAYFAVTSGTRILTGTERMKHRPIGALVDALRFLGADITYLGDEGFPPLLIKGKPLEGGDAEIAGNISSQYISALLMIGPVLEKGLRLKMTGSIVSRPYIELTLWMMREFGADANWSESDTLTVRRKLYADCEYLIENDWSAASYWYEIAAIMASGTSSIRLNGLFDGSKQGDSAVKYIFSVLGVKTTFDTRRQNVTTDVTLRKLFPTAIRRLEHDFTNSPDLAQTMAATCALLDIPFRFTGLASLKIKETNRIEALKKEMRKIGYIVYDENDDTLIWDGTRCEPTGEPIDTYDDHRMAMALAPAAIKFPGLRMNDPEVVSKSYPHFWDDLRAAGFTITER